MPRATDTREQIMDRAADLLLQRGFNGFSYRDIATHLGVKNAAVHYHFPSKADLALALVEEYHQVLRKGTAEFMAYGGPARPQLEGLFAFTEHQFGHGRCICPFGAFSVDFPDLPESVRGATTRFLEDSLAWLTRVMEVGREQGEFSFSGDPKQQALLILSTLTGARQMARISGQDVLPQVFTGIRSTLGIRT